MKKVLFILACALCTLNAIAQRASSTSTSFFSSEKADAPITFGIRAGVNFPKMTASSDGYDTSTKSNVGFNAGVCVDFPMLESLYLQTGLYYTVKGAKIEDGGETMKYNPGYLEIPIMASYRYNFTDAAQLQFNFGPYIAYGISGKQKWEYEGESDEMDMFGDDSGVKRFDAGLGVGAGVTVGKFYVGLNYEFGLMNIADDTDGDYSIKNKNLSISVGFNF